MKHGWTGGQYSLFRVALGVYLCFHFAQLIPWAAELYSSSGVFPDGGVSPLLKLFPNVFLISDAPWFATALTALGVPLALLLAVGRFDRSAALMLWYLLACQYGRNPLTLNPSLPYVGLLLVVHALLPKAPYGSLAARGRVDPRGGWALPDALHGVLWLLMSVGYSYSGYTKLVSASWLDGSALRKLMDNPLTRHGWPRDLFLALPEGFTKLMTWGLLGTELLFLPLAIWSRSRPWIWLAMVLMHLGILVLVDFADLTLGMLLLHIATFNPLWIPALRVEGRGARVYYDGSCGVCHGAVRFLLAEDRQGDGFRFAPLDSTAYREAVDEQSRAAMPDTMVVVDGAGKIHARSSGILFLAAALGGWWRVLAAPLRLIPRPLLDLGYDGFARVRHRLVATPDGACPILPPDLQQRFFFD